MHVCMCVYTFTHDYLLFPPWGTGGLVRFFRALQCETLCVFLVYIPGAQVSLNLLSQFCWWDWHAGESENRSIGNGQPHAGCVEAEEDGMVPSMAVFQ